MTCEQRRDLILLYAADALDDQERSAVVAHLESGCSYCAGSLAESRQTVLRIAQSVDPVEPPTAVRARLMARAMADVNVSQQLAMRPRLVGSALTGAWIGAAAIAATVGLLLYVKIFTPLNQQVASLSRRVASLQSELAVVQNAQQRDTESLQVLQSPAVQLVALQSTVPGTPMAARILWDHTSNEWHFRAAGLKPLPPGRTYELWFINAANKPARAATFDVDARGDASARVTVPAALGVLAVAAVTEEPAGGSNAPTSNPILAGNITR